MCSLSYFARDSVPSAASIQFTRWQGPQCSFFDLLDFQHELWIRLFMMNQQARPARC